MYSNSFEHPCTTGFAGAARALSRLRLWVAAVLLVFAPVHATLAADVPEMKPVQVSPSAWYVQGQSALGSPENQNFISNAAFVVTPAGVVVIDALGSPVLAERLLDAIRQITPKPVTHVILTHYHADHIYGLQVFKATGATILAHRAGEQYLNSDTARQRLEVSRKDLAPWINADTRMVPADRWLDGAETLEVGGMQFQIRPVGPSHTPEDLAVWLPKEQVLFAGDLVFRSRIPFVGQADSGHWIQALDQLLAYDAKVIVPGHGPISTEARKDMQLTRDYLIYLRKTMRQAAINMDPFEDAYKAADWTPYEHLPLFQAANRMNAYNTYLLMEREAK